MDVLYFQVGSVCTMYERNCNPGTLGLAWVFGRSLHAILGHPEMGGLCVQMMGFSWWFAQSVTLQVLGSLGGRPRGSMV